MSQLPVVCPECGHRWLVTGEYVNAQTNCPQCSTVFTIHGQQDESAPAVRRQLLCDADPQAEILAPYRLLAAHGITPASSLAEVQEVFPETQEEERAVTAIDTVVKRLGVDLFLYPLPGPAHET